MGTMDIQGMQSVDVLGSVARTRPVALPEANGGLAELFRLTDRLYRAQNPADVYDAALDAILAGLSCERCSILLFDDDGVMRFVAWRGLSEHYRTSLEGHSPWMPETMEPDPIFVRDISLTGEPEAVKQTIMAEGIRSLAFIPLTIGGRVVGKFMAYRRAPESFSEADQAMAVTIARQLGFSIERMRLEEQRARALAELKDSEEHFRLMSEHAPVMIWMSDANGNCLHLNRMLREFWKIEESAIKTFDWRTSMHEDDIPSITTAMIDAHVNHRPVTIDGRYRCANGEYRTLRTVAQPRFEKGGGFSGMTGVNIDITEQQRAEAQRELLMAELNHRVKNTLAVVQGLAHQTFRKSDRDATRSFEGRLLALAGAHSLLTRSNWENAALRKVAADALQIMGEGQRIVIDGADIMLSPRAALSLALALHELFTNTMKYGALSCETGAVRLNWSIEDRARVLAISWQESGGPRVKPPNQRGFGSLLIEKALAQDVQGEVNMEYKPEGLVCSISLPFGRNGGHAWLA
jgi:PAS domain S-box-containing protein